VEQLRCMSCVLKYHFPHFALDLDSLRRTCESLSTQNPPPDRNETTLALPELSGIAKPSDDARLSENPRIENQDCTIDLIDDTTVRMLSYPLLPAASLTKLPLVMQTTLANSHIGTFPCTSSAMWTS
jgi:hypothetical protein